MPLTAVERHPHARAVLSVGLERPSHAYLFHGPAGAGKREAARAFAAHLLSAGAPDPANAARRVLQGVHPDLTWVRPSGAREMMRIDIEEPVVAAATRTPFESARRVFVLEDVDTLNDAAANRMLKTLEEPPPFAHLLLLTDRPGDVLPTIRSRCQLVRFEAPTPEELAERLQRHGVQPAQAQACARLALGDGERALELALKDGPALRASAEAFARASLHGRTREKPWLAMLERARDAGDRATEEVEERLKATLQLLPGKEQARAKREAADAGKRASRRGRTDALDEALQLVGLWLRDVAVVLDGAQDLVFATDRLEQLDQDAATQRQAHGLREGVAWVDETRAALKLVNATEELALEALAYRLELGLRSP